VSVYSVEVAIWATVYVRASSQEEALELLRGEGGEKEHSHFLEFPICDPGIEISGARFDDENLPEVSMSPAMTMTLTGITADKFDLVED
jgi:hypothetical protein